MSELFDRAYRLTVGTTQIDASRGVNTPGLRIQFAVARDEKRQPNSCEFRVYNLKRSTREALAAANEVSVSLEAGYVGFTGQIFLGDLRSVRTERQGADFVTIVRGGDGEALLRTAKINRTFRAGTSVGEVLKGLGAALGVGRGNVDAAARALTERLPASTTLCGLIFDELEAFCRTHGLRWSVQDSALQVRTGDEPVRAGQAPLLRADSGLLGQCAIEAHGKATKSGDVKAVGSGKAGKKLVSGSCLLRPELLPGVPFRVESETFTGNLVCTQSTARGDSHGSEWQTDWVGRPY